MLLSSSTSDSIGRVQRSVGTEPDRLLALIANEDREIRLPKAEGIVPLKLFTLKSMTPKLVMFWKVGMVPVRSLSFKLKYWSWDSCPTEVGIDPVICVDTKNRSCSDVSWPTVDGIGPFTLLL